MCSSDLSAEAYGECVRLGDQWGSPFKWPSLYYGWANALHRLGRHKEELQASRKALIIWPDEPIFLRYVAAAYLDMPKDKKAEETLEQMAAAATGDDWPVPRLLYNYGRAYEHADRFDTAEGYYQQAIAADTTYPWFYYGLGDMLIDHNIDPRRGVELARRALELSPDNSSILDTYGWGLYKLGRYAEALKILEQSWALAVESGYDARLRLKAARKAVAEQ